MTSFDRFKTGFINQHGLVNVEEAIWIKPKIGNNAKPRILSSKSVPPNFIDIPGESVRTWVFEYMKQPLICSNCLKFGHSKSVRRDSAKCRNCGSMQHATISCNANVICFHCRQNHQAGNNKCIEYRYEQEILTIQSNSKVSKSKAKFISDREKPNFWNMDFAGAARQNLVLPRPAPPPSSPKHVNPVHLQSSLTNPPTLKSFTNKPVNITAAKLISSSVENLVRSTATSWQARIIP